jgi:hypothetical protein
MVIEYKYKIFLTENIDSVNWENSAIKRENVRYNLEGNKFIIRLVNPTSEEEVLTHEETLQIMQGSEWTETDDL